LQAGGLAAALYVAGMFVFDMTVNVSYHGLMLVLLLVNAVVARFTDVTTIYVVPTPSKPKPKDKDKAAPVQSASGDVPAAKQD